MSEAEAVAPTPEVAPAAPAPVAAGEMTWEQIKASATSGEVSPNHPDGAPATNAEPVADWDAELPKPVIRSAAERIAAKQAAAREAAKRAPLEAQLQQERERYQQLTASQQAAEAEFRQHLESGNIDAAFKVKGISSTFEDMQKQLLRAKGALPPADPRYEKLEAELKAEREQRTKREQAEAAERQKAEGRRQWEADVKAIGEELGALPHQGAKELAGAPGVAEAVTRMLVNSPDLTLTQAAARVRADYLELYRSLQPVFGQTAAKNPHPGVSNGLPARPGAVPVAEDLDSITDPDARWAAIKAKALRATQQ